jgi:hypothetical protein
MGYDVRIAPHMLAEFVMRTFFDLNDIWSEEIKALRLMGYFDYILKENWEVAYTYVGVLPTSTIVSRPPLLP